jgi:hypothetical protein
MPWKILTRLLKTFTERTNGFLSGAFRLLSPKSLGEQISPVPHQENPWSNSPAALARTANSQLCVTTHIECGVLAAHATSIRGKKQKGDEGGIDEISVPTLSYIYSMLERDNDGDT